MSLAARGSTGRGHTVKGQGEHGRGKLNQRRYSDSLFRFLLLLPLNEAASPTSPSGFLYSGARVFFSVLSLSAFRLGRLCLHRT